MFEIKIETGLLFKFKSGLNILYGLDVFDELQPVISELIKYNFIVLDLSESSPLFSESQFNEFISSEFAFDRLSEYMNKDYYPSIFPNSGCLKKLMQIYFALNNKNIEKLIVLYPETCLHISLQTELAGCFEKFFGVKDCILFTHSPFIGTYYDDDVVKVECLNN